MGAKLRIAGAAAAILAIAACSTAQTNDETPTAASSASGLTTTPATTTPTNAPAAFGSQPVHTQVTRVIDGDTFEIAGGQRVRLLGIDSCELQTPGGAQAKTEAERILFGGRQIELQRETSGDDKDPDGRLLRYVLVDGEDFGVQMVQWDHTGVYQGQHDASDTYVSLLYQNDTKRSANPPSGRECGEPRPAAAPAPERTEEPKPAPRADEGEKEGGGSSVSYKNCSEVRAAGKAPIRRGDPGYGRHLDRDGDGQGCAGD